VTGVGCFIRLLIVGCPEVLETVGLVVCSTFEGASDDKLGTGTEVGFKELMFLSVTEEGLEVAGVLSTQYVAVTLILSTPALNSFKGFSLMTLKAKNNASSVKTSFGIVKAICSLRSVASPNPRSKPLERVSFVQVTPDSSSSPGPLTFGPRSIITESSPLPSTTRNSSSTVQSSIW